jgi:D-alanine-D-alanine ligase
MRKKRPPRCDIALLVDEETGDYLRDGRFRVERHSVEAHVLSCLATQRRRVEVVPVDPAIQTTIARLRALEPRLVFNLTEWVDGDRHLDAAVAGLLDMLKLPYTGAGPDGLRLARDKALSKAVVQTLGVAVPRHFIPAREGRIHNPGLPYPLLVKPQFDDGSVGISGRSLVRNGRELRARLRRARRSSVPLMCEEFIAGRDLFVAVMGNAPFVLPAVELVIGRRGSAAPRFMTYRVKHDRSYSSRWRVAYRVPELPAAVVTSINAASRAVFHALKLRDYARIDYRLAPDGRLYFIEANPNPDLSPHAFGRNRCFAGMEYPALIEAIVAAACRRYRLRSS